MPSAKILEKKQAECQALAEKIRNSAAGVVVGYTGITVEQDTQLRAALRAAGVEYKVYKNKMIGRACEECGYGEINNVLEGMNAIAVSAEDPIVVVTAARYRGDVGERIILCHMFSPFHKFEDIC